MSRTSRHDTEPPSVQLSHTHLSPEFVVTFLVAALSQVFSLLLSWELDRIVLEITEITKSPVSNAGTFGETQEQSLHEHNIPVFALVLKKSILSQFSRLHAASRTE